MSKYKNPTRSRIQQCSSSKQNSLGGQSNRSTRSNKSNISNNSFSSNSNLQGTPENEEKRGETPKSIPKNLLHNQKSKNSAVIQDKFRGERRLGNNMNTNTNTYNKGKRDIDIKPRSKQQTEGKQLHTTGGSFGGYKVLNIPGGRKLGEGRAEDIQRLFDNTWKDIMREESSGSMEDKPGRGDLGMKRRICKNIERNKQHLKGKKEREKYLSARAKPGERGERGEPPEAVESYKGMGFLPSPGELLGSMTERPATSACSGRWHAQSTMHPHPPQGKGKVRSGSPSPVPSKSYMRYGKVDLTSSPLMHRERSMDHINTQILHRGPRAKYNTQNKYNTGNKYNTQNPQNPENTSNPPQNPKIQKIEIRLEKGPDVGPGEAGEPGETVEVGVFRETQAFLNLQEELAQIQRSIEEEKSIGKTLPSMESRESPNYPVERADSLEKACHIRMGEKAGGQVPRCRVKGSRSFVDLGLGAGSKVRRTRAQRLLHNISFNRGNGGVSVSSKARETIDTKSQSTENTPSPRTVAQLNEKCEGIQVLPTSSNCPRVPPLNLNIPLHLNQNILNGGPYSTHSSVHPPMSVYIHLDPDTDKANFKDKMKTLFENSTNTLPDFYKIQEKVYI